MRPICCALLFALGCQPEAPEGPEAPEAHGSEMAYGIPRGSVTADLVVVGDPPERACRLSWDGTVTAIVKVMSDEGTGDGPVQLPSLEGGTLAIKPGHTAQIPVPELTTACSGAVQPGAGFDRAP